MYGLSNADNDVPYFHEYEDLELCIFLLVPVSSDAIKYAFESPRPANFAEVKIRTGNLSEEGRSGYMVRVPRSSQHLWKWRIGSAIDSDLYLPGLDEDCAEIHLLGFEDDDIGEELSLILRKLGKQDVGVGDWLTCSNKKHVVDTLISPRRCLIRPDKMRFGEYAYDVYHPWLSDEQLRLRRCLLRTLRTIERCDEAKSENLYKQKTVGIGSYATVKQCVDRSNGRVYARKKIRVETSKTKGTFDDIAKEIKVMKDIRHINVVNSVPYVHKHNKRQDKAAYILMPCFRDTLETAITKGLLSDAQKLDVMFQILEGLDHLHLRHDQMHRDLKPNNVLLTFKDDGSVVAKIADFGLSAKLTDGVAESSRGGNEWYRGPEFANRALGPIGGPADMFAYAVVFVRVVAPASWKKALRATMEQASSCNKPNEGTWPQKLRAIAAEQDLGGLEKWISACLSCKTKLRPTVVDFGGMVNRFNNKSPVICPEKIMKLRHSYDSPVIEDYDGSGAETLAQHQFSPDSFEQGISHGPAARKRALEQANLETDTTPPRKRRRPSSRFISEPDNDSSRLLSSNRRRAHPSRQSRDDLRPRRPAPVDASRSQSGLYRSNFDFRPDPSAPEFPILSFGDAWRVSIVLMRTALADSICRFAAFVGSTPVNPLPQQQQAGGRPTPSPALARRPSSQIKLENQEGTAQQQ
ncbi:serine/threonine-protein kinase pef1 [Sphaceloma murrayae]|uniref:Serine/threonine-protein kinase pef1 n=1 Tax=Sphaceloma murrayae TaxID=2082308 RepID=A0A2K1QZZ3_9PEZI|nr:serine/threonine-protein kinase pef1 [Sphaceloma murrayae]